MSKLVEEKWDSKKFKIYIKEKGATKQGKYKHKIRCQS